MNGDSTLASFHATVQGRVQGVFFRAFEWELGDVRDIWTFESSDIDFGKAYMQKFEYIIDALIPDQEVAMN